MNLNPSARRLKDEMAHHLIELQAKLEAEGVSGEAEASREQDVVTAQQTALTEEGTKLALKDQRVRVATLEAEAVAGENESQASIAASNATLSERQAEARRRVMITLWSVPPPNRQSTLFRLVHSENQKFRPGHRELMSVLWDMGILPDIRVMPEDPWWDTEVPQTREEALDMAVQSGWRNPADGAKARGVVEANFEELFKRSSEGYQPLWRAGARELLITWETNNR